MSLWDKAKAELLDIVEWNDDSCDTMVWRFPRFDNEIKYGAQLIVRQAQAAVFVDRGKIADIFPSGQYRLTTGNLPILTTLLGWKYGFHSAFKAEVYFVNLRNFTNLKWGTKKPLIIRDPELGPVRLRSFGTYVIRVGDPGKFINEIAGTDAHFTVDGISEQLRNLIASRLADVIGESGVPLLDLAANYGEFSTLLAEKVAPEFLEYGVEITKLLIENISLPNEVEEALDKRSSMGIISDMDTFTRFQAANSMEAAARNQGGEASAGIGMGIGFAMANQFGKILSPPGDNSGQNSKQPASGSGYFVAEGGNKTGPFEYETVLSMIVEGRVTEVTLLWKQGMERWEKAAAFDELGRALRNIPPPIPT